MPFACEERPAKAPLDRIARTHRPGGLRHLFPIPDVRTIGLFAAPTGLAACAALFPRYVTPGEFSKEPSPLTPLTLCYGLAIISRVFSAAARRASATVISPATALFR